MIGLPGWPSGRCAIEKRLRPTVTIEDLDEQAKGGDAAKKLRAVRALLPGQRHAAAAAAASRSGPATEAVAILWDAGLSRAEADKHGN